MTRLILKLKGGGVIFDGHADNIEIKEFSQPVLIGYGDVTPLDAFEQQMSYTKGIQIEMDAKLGVNGPAGFIYDPKTYTPPQWVTTLTPEALAAFPTPYNIYSTAQPNWPVVTKCVAGCPVCYPAQPPPIAKYVQNGKSNKPFPSILANAKERVNGMDAEARMRAAAIIEEAIEAMDTDGWIQFAEHRPKP